MRKALLLLPCLLVGFVYAQITLPIDFESSTVAYTFTDFDGGGSTVINNPNPGGINTSAKVGQMIKSAGQVWGGSYLELAAPIDFTVNKLFTMKVYSPRVGARVLLKVEDPTNGAIFFEKEDTSTVANMWEELTFDYSAVDTTQTFQKIVLIWDLGVAGDGSSNFTFQFDDINLTSITGPVLDQIKLPVTFEDSATDYTMTPFGGVAANVIVDPTDPTNHVGEFYKDTTSQLWGGVTVSTPLGLASAIPFTATDSKISMRIWSPDAGIPIRLKAEDHTNNMITVETETMTTVASAWETIVFDFNNEVMGTPALDLNETYDLLALFCNFGTDGATAGNKTYYFDDIMMDTTVVVGVPETAIAGLRYFPNPVNDRITVEADQTIEMIQIYDLAGRMLREVAPNTQNVELNLSDLSKGSYILRMRSNTTVKNVRIVKQ